MTPGPGFRLGVPVTVTVTGQAAVPLAAKQAPTDSESTAAAAIIIMMVPHWPQASESTEARFFAEAAARRRH